MAMRDKIEHAIQNQPCTVKDLKNKFGGDRGADRKVMEAVDQLVHEAVICQRQGVFFTVRSGRADKALLCKVVKLGKNFAFVMLEDGTSDIFIPGRFTRGAMPGDKVLVEKFAHPRVEGSDEGEILAVLEEKNSLVGTMHRMEGRLKFVPDDCPAISMQVMRDCEGSAKDGDKVAVEILLRGNRQEDHRVGVAMRFGSCDEAKRCAKALLYAQDIRNRFPDKVRDEAKKLDNAEVSAADCEGRMDLRALPIFTIDSAETKDIDDAISLTKTPDGGFELGVHIADVSNYVQEHSALDVEALSRGTSVYLVDRVIPMLPHKLSNGICSLNAGENRLTLSCVMTIDAKGNVIDHTIAESVIKVDRRMSYTSVKKILEDHDENEIREYEELVPMFELMQELAAILRKKRMKRGSIDFDFPETKIVLDDKGKPVEIKPYERNVATKIIEDFMLIANETVAQDYFWQELPFVYRTHDNPDTEKIKKLSTFINNFGYSIHIGQDEVHPKELQKLLQKIDGTPEEALISRLTLRSMKQAKYTTMSTGHFGLATPYYCHFTSPIRRYPDLQIHRIIKDNLRGRMNAKKIEHYDKILPEVAKHSSEMERRADEAERETDKLKKVEYMSERIGEVFEGVISGVTEWGFYVELPNTVEGLVHVTTLVDDYFHYNESTYELVGEVTNIRYKLGQRVHVMVTGTDKILRTIDFRVVRENEEE